MVGISGKSLSWGRASMLNYYEPSTGVDDDTQCIPVSGSASRGELVVQTFTIKYNRNTAGLFFTTDRFG